MAKTEDWGLAREITHCWELDDDITTLAIKLEAYQHDIDAAWVDLIGYELCLMLMCTAEGANTLQNVACK
jgi:hypothetical protein